MLFFPKKSDISEPQKGFVANEEIDSKRTSKLGYFFLILMVILGVWQGQGFLNALQRSITAPSSHSQCLLALVSEYNENNSDKISGYGYYGSGYYASLPTENGCSYSKREIAVGIPQLYLSVYPTLIKKQTLNKELSDVNSRIESLKYNRTQKIDEYSVSLLETIAKESAVLSVGSLKESIKTSDDLLRLLNIAQSDLGTRLVVVNTDIGGLVSSHKNDFTSISDRYNYEMNVYQLKQFALSVLFILPFFLILWRRYNRSKNARSEFAIIWAGALAIASIMLAQVLLVFVYEILPRELLQKVFAFFSKLEFFFVFAYWIGFILVPVFFGGLIYFIQKRYYNKKAVTARAFKANKCPTCLMSVAPHMVFCPMCGTTLKVKCSSCGAHSPEAGGFCEVCGVKR